MTDYSKLKLMAEAATGFMDMNLAPDVVLDLIAESERLLARDAEHVRQFNELSDFRQRTVEAFEGKVSELQAEIESLRKDAERLVFCTSHPEQQFFQGELGWGVMDCADGLSIPFKDADSLRSAIDRVMSKDSSHD